MNESQKFELNAWLKQLTYEDAMGVIRALANAPDSNITVYGVIKLTEKMFIAYNETHPFAEKKVYMSYGNM